MDSSFFLSRRLVLRAAMSLAAVLPAAAVQADNYPSKPIQLVIPAPPGGGTDGMARLTANALASSVNWKVVPDNRPGAGGNIGFDLAFKAPPDGYTLALGESSNMVVNQYLYTHLPFDIKTDMLPIALIARVPLVLIVGANGPYLNIEALTAAGKKRSLSFASSGNGTLAHLVGELWKGKAGMDMVHIPYRGAAPAITDLIGGQVDLFFASVPVALPMIQAGKVRALAVTAPDRISVLQDVPTMAEAGYPEMEASVVFGLVGPGGIPKRLAQQINAEVNRALQRPESGQLLAAMGVERAPGSFGGDPESFGKVLQAERAKWAPVVKASGAKVD
ncbi:MAG TPA: tripartite tricarboxylate transporter substrate binding protein [Burkholderiaceae bacterium]|nr:tripartite tricarboxylate transporter substrate binding protein [Burkholderiaceae bacterium]